MHYQHSGFAISDMLCRVDVRWLFMYVVSLLEHTFQAHISQCHAMAGIVRRAAGVRAMGKQPHHSQEMHAIRPDVICINMVMCSMRTKNILRLKCIRCNIKAN